MQLALFEQPEEAEQRWASERASARQRIRQRLAWHRHKIDLLHMKLALLSGNADPFIDNEP